MVVFFLFLRPLLYIYIYLKLLEYFSISSYCGYSVFNPVVFICPPNLFLSCSFNIDWRSSRRYERNFNCFLCYMTLRRRNSQYHNITMIQTLQPSLLCQQVCAIEGERE